MAARVKPRCTPPIAVQIKAPVPEAFERTLAARGGLGVLVHDAGGLIWV